MKVIWVFVLNCWLCSCALAQSDAVQPLNVVTSLTSNLYVGTPRLPGNLVRVEKLTEAEKSQRLAAIAEVEKARRNLRETEAKIAAEHKMDRESYMEWSSWYEFDGDYVLERRQSVWDSWGATVRD